MAGIRTDGGGMRVGRIIGRFGEVVILSHHDCYLSLKDDILAKMIETGISTADLAMASFISPTAELSTRTVDFCRSGLFRHLRPTFCDAKLINR